MDSTINIAKAYAKYFDKQAIRIDKKIEKYKNENNQNEKTTEFLKICKEIDAIDKERFIAIASDKIMIEVERFCNKLKSTIGVSINDIIYEIHKLISINFMPTDNTHHHTYKKYYGWFCDKLTHFEKQRLEELKKHFNETADEIEKLFWEFNILLIRHNIITFFISLIQMRDFNNMTALKEINTYTYDIRYGIEIFNLLSQAKKQNISQKHFTRNPKHYNQKFLSVSEIVNTIDETRIKYRLSFANELLKILKIPTYKKMPKLTKRQILTESVKIKTATYMLKTAKREYRDKYSKLLSIKERQKRRAVILDLKGNLIPQKTLKILKKPLTNDEIVFLTYSQPLDLMEKYNPNDYIW